MSLSVERVLAERLATGRQTSRLGLWISALLHGAFLATLVLTPMLTPDTADPVRFVNVALVSAQALGVREPVPAQPAPRRAEPAPPAPEPEREPATRPEPAVPSPDPAPSRRATEEREPARPTAGPPQIQRRQGSPTGSATGTAALGARVGFDNPNFRHSYFVDRLTAMLAAQWQRPAIGGELAALVRFTIHRDGTISNLAVVESSGYSSYDLAALRAVQQAAPFPPLPQSYDGSTLGVTVEFI